MAATTHIAQAGETVRIDPAAGPWVIETPLQPQHGQTFAIKTINRSRDLVLIDPRVHAIEAPHTGDIVTGATVDMSLDSGVIRWEYDGPNDTWNITDEYAKQPYEEVYRWTIAGGWVAVLGTRQILVNAGAGGLTCRFTDDLEFQTEMTAEIILTGNNQDIEYNWVPTITGGVEEAFPVYGSLASPRSGTFKQTHSGIYLWSPAAIGNTWDLDTTDTGGVGTSTRYEILVVVSLL